MTRRLHTTTVRLRDRLAGLRTDAARDEGTSSVEYVLLTVLGIAVAGLIAVAVTAFVTGQIALF